MEATPFAQKKVIWKNLVFFSVTTLVGVIGAPLYICRFGLRAADLWLFAFYMAATGMSITVGYHRLFSHASFKANSFIQSLLLFFGAAAFEEPALDWSSEHRNHHRYVDTDRDPYSIKKGFWYAHIGWLLFWEHKRDYENVKDLKRNKLLMHQHQYYLAWAVVSGILLPIFIGSLTGHTLGALVLSVCLRITLVYHCTFFINSICHMFGKATYDIYATAKDHWLIAFLTYGEGYHNFHHRFPSDYRNGVRWYQWDPSKWLIYFFSWFGLSWDLKRVSNIRILEARLAGEHQRARDSLERFLGFSEITAKTLGLFQEQYARVRQCLLGWDHSVKEYQGLARQEILSCSEEFQKAALKKMKQAQHYFYEVRKQWNHLVEMHPRQLQKWLNNVSTSFPRGGV